VLANEPSVASVCALIKIILQTISPVAECGVRMLHVAMNPFYVVLWQTSELLSQLSSVRSRALGGPHSLSSHFSQLEMQLASSRFVSTIHVLTVHASSTTPCAV